MSKISKSPDRFSFQRNGYVERQTKNNEPISEAYLDMFDKILNEYDHKFDAESSRQNNLEYDLLSNHWILEKVRASDTYAQNLYAAMCNREFQKLDVLPILKEQTWSCSWRYSGGIIADMQEKGDYINWYCSGIGSGLGNGDEDGSKGYVPESVVTEEIENDLKQLGWIVLEQDMDNQI